jgi:hypothetical protein
MERLEKRRVTGVPQTGHLNLSSPLRREDMKTAATVLVIAFLVTVAGGGTASEAVVWVRGYDSSIYEKPSFVSAAVGRAHFSQPLSLLGATDEWYHVTTGNRQQRLTFDGTNGWIPTTNDVPLEGWIHNSSVTTNPLPPAAMADFRRPTALWSGHGGSNEAMRVIKELERGPQRRPSVSISVDPRE